MICGVTCVCVNGVHDLVADELSSEQLVHGHEALCRPKRTRRRHGLRRLRRGRQGVLLEKSKTFNMMIVRLSVFSESNIMCNIISSRRSWNRSNIHCAGVAGRIGPIARRSGRFVALVVG